MTTTIGAPRPARRRRSPCRESRRSSPAQSRRRNHERDRSRTQKQIDFASKLSPLDRSCSVSRHSPSSVPLRPHYFAFGDMASRIQRGMHAARLMLRCKKASVLRPLIPRPRRSPPSPPRRSPRMPSSAAFFSFDPAPGPATTRSVFADTDPATRAPSASACALASSRLSVSSVPVKTTVLPRDLAMRASRRRRAAATPRRADRPTPCGCAARGRSRRAPRPTAGADARRSARSRVERVRRRPPRAASRRVRADRGQRRRTCASAGRAR